ncbi:hypothetical protein HY612_00945 [Candidatus Roizmanbacteria bacterium]|nr:hypothetical protein [Candidatus Roizmanbacteria bacterium]
MKKEQKIILIIGLVLIIVGAISMVYFLIQNRKLKKALIETNFNQINPKEFSFDEVSNLTKLPTDEQPTIVRIKDAEKAKEQSFFKKAKDGDIILLYKKAKLAVLYDPIKKEIIESGPLIEASSSAEGTSD